MADFDSLWVSAVRYRRVSRKLRPLVRAVHDKLQKLEQLKLNLERLLAFLASAEGRTDANCCTVDRFFAACESEWTDLPPSLRGILEAMSGTLHDTIYAPHIAANFESLPEQLLQRVRQIETVSDVERQASGANKSERPSDA